MEIEKPQPVPVDLSTDTIDEVMQATDISMESESELNAPSQGLEASTEASDDVSEAGQLKSEAESLTSSEALKDESKADEKSTVCSSVVETANPENCTDISGSSEVSHSRLPEEKDLNDNRPVVAPESPPLGCNSSAIRRPELTAAQIFYSSSSMNLSDDDGDGMLAILKAPAFDEEDQSAHSLLSRSYDRSVLQSPTIDDNGNDAPRTPAQQLMDSAIQLEKKVTDALANVSLEVKNASSAKKGTPLSLIKSRLLRAKESSSDLDIENIGVDLAGCMSPIPRLAEFTPCMERVTESNDENTVSGSPTFKSPKASTGGAVEKELGDGQEMASDSFARDDDNIEEILVGPGGGVNEPEEASAVASKMPPKTDSPTPEKKERDDNKIRDAPSDERSVGQIDVLESTRASDNILNISDASTRPHQDKESSSKSEAFFNKLKGAAFKRKMNLVKSRDSLVAKEKLHRQELQQERRREQELSEEVEFDVEPPPAPPTSSHTFKARPVPVAAGAKGTGGYSGVPAVEKKPTTTPFSPLLGARRKLQRIAKPFARGGEKTNKDSETEQRSSSAFRALPLPQSTGYKGKAGVSGVPEVKARPVTVPFSPLLGGRRKSVIAGADVEKNPNLSSVSLPSMVSNCMSRGDASATSSGPSLAGLCLLNDENQVQCSTPKDCLSTSFPGYVPHSTKRAQDRAAYDVQRKEGEKQRRELDQKLRQQQTKQIDKKLRTLRSSLT